MEYFRIILITMASILTLFLSSCIKKEPKKENPKAVKIEKTRYERWLEFQHRDSIRALKDFNNEPSEKMKLIFHGPPPTEKQMIFDSLLTNKYKIEVIEAGCKTYPGDNLYNILMSDRIREKYGDCFFVNVNKEIITIMNEKNNHHSQKTR